LVNPSETVLEAAFRELKEETSIDLNQHLKSLENIQPLPTIESNSKLYWIYFYDDMTGKLFQHKLKCTSLIENEYIPIRNGLPEHDKFKWVTKEEGKKLIFESLISVFDSI
jgi:8-oxo-dGTP pyrophosphatase MutT (NUDIX family)